MRITMERQSSYSLHQIKISPRTRLMRSSMDRLNAQTLHLARITVFVGSPHQFFHLANTSEGHHLRQYCCYTLENGLVLQISVFSTNRTHTSTIWADTRQSQNIVEKRVFFINIEEVPQAGCSEILQYSMSFEGRSNLMQDLKLPILINWCWS